MEVETIFDRAQTMKPCNIGAQGTCCKNCAQGPCRLPLPKGGIEGEDTRKGKKRPRTAADKQLNLVEKLMMNVARIHKRV
jgi:hydroxylamine reductase (hybrid-cluster protein)